MNIRKLIALSCFLTGVGSVNAADYVIDTQGGHASVDFRFKHLNIAWLTGEFKDFDGTFSFDAADMQSSKVEVNIRTASIDSNHAERDKHMRGEKFLNTEKFPDAKFVSTKVTDMVDGRFTVQGNLTLHGVTKAIAIEAKQVGEGKDPWGGYRAGFEGTTTINTGDFGMTFPPTNSVELYLYIEGKRQ